MSEQGLTLWLTGLSGAGKSTVGSRVADELRRRGHRVELLDGEHARRALSPRLGFSKEDRDDHVQRLAYVADLLSRNGVMVVVAAISPYREGRRRARALLGDRFAEVHVEASVDACARRDPKGLYSEAARGDLPRFTGVSHPYEPPEHAELVLHTEREDPEESVAAVLTYLDRRR